MRSNNKPVDRACYALCALRAVESLIGQINQLEDNGSNLSLLLTLIADDIEDAVNDMHEQSTKQKAA